MPTALWVLWSRIAPIAITICIATSTTSATPVHAKLDISILVLLNVISVKATYLDAIPARRPLYVLLVMLDSPSHIRVSASAPQDFWLLESVPVSMVALLPAT